MRDINEIINGFKTILKEQTKSSGNYTQLVENKIHELGINKPNATVEEVQDYYMLHLLYPHPEDSEIWQEYEKICKPYCEKYDIVQWVGRYHFKVLSQQELNKLYSQMKQLVQKHSEINELEVQRPPRIWDLTKQGIKFENIQIGDILQFIINPGPEIVRQKIIFKNVDTNRIITQDLDKNGNLKSTFFDTWLKPDLEDFWEKESINESIEDEEVFQQLKKYVGGYKEDYSSIDLSKISNLFKKLKKQYPELLDSKLNPEDYIYRGTYLNQTQLDQFSKNKEQIPYDQGYIIQNINYQSKRQVQSWSVDYYSASSFAASKQNKGIPVVIRVKVKDADVYWNSDFINLINNYNEKEVLNIKPILKSDIMVLNLDKFEDEETFELSKHIKIPKDIYNE